MASKLTKSDYTKTSLRAYLLQNGMNYNNYQGLGGSDANEIKGF